MRKTNSQNKRSHRAALATVELAVCLPLVLMVTFGGIEGASMLFTKQALVTSAYEGIKVAIANDSNPADVVEAVKSVLADRSLEDVSVVIDPADFQSLNRGDLITVTVSAPGDANSVIPFGPFQGRLISVNATMVKE